MPNTEREMEARESLSQQQFERLKAGDQAVFKRVYNQYFGLVNYVVVRCGLTDAESLDVVQESFLKLYKNLASIENAQSIKSWLVSTARNLAIDYIRKSKVEHNYINRSKREASVVDGQELIADSLVRELEVALLSELLICFEQETNDDTFTLFYKYGKSTKQIAEEKGEPISTVTNRISRARKKFRHYVDTHIQTLRDNMY